jgi:hypothetical protein
MNAPLKPSRIPPPPPIRYAASSTAKPAAAKSLQPKAVLPVHTRVVPPPPTRYGASAAAQLKTPEMTRVIAPPPTRYAPASNQRDAARASPYSPTPARSAHRALLQPSTGSDALVVRPRTIQRMDTSEASLTTPSVGKTEINFDASRMDFRVKQGHVDFLDKTKTLVRGNMSGMTIHHKISQSNLKLLTSFLGDMVYNGDAPQREATNKLINVIVAYMAIHGETNSSLFRLLNNMPLNLAYGPTSRWYHMGEKFDPTVDTSSEVVANQNVIPGPSEEKKLEIRPKLHRSLSARSLQLSYIDQIILNKIPRLAKEWIPMRTHSDTTVFLGEITGFLQKAVEADLSENKNPFHQASHWTKEHNRYVRLTTPEVLATWDPSDKPQLSLADLNRQKTLDKLKSDLAVNNPTMGAKQRLASYINNFFASITGLSGKFTKESVMDYYREEIEFVEQARIFAGAKAVKWANGKKELLEVPSDTDDQIAEAYGDIIFVLGDRF